MVYPALGIEMDLLLHQRADEIAELCRKYRVRNLYVFGSILRADFDPARSDADFLVEFDPSPAADRMANYLGLREGLRALLDRPVDLTEEGSIRNPYVVQSISEQRRLLYAA